VAEGSGTSVGDARALLRRAHDLVELVGEVEHGRESLRHDVEAAFTTLREQMVQRELTNIPTALADWWTPSEPADDRLGDTVVSADRYRGNAADDGRDNRGWILGHFIESSKDVRSTRDVEVKRGIHPAGEKRPEWTTGDQRTKMALLVAGNFVVSLSDGSVELARQGDYAVRGPGIDHSREAKGDPVVITVRWPSSSS
jgi:quercetin dioxygenase-like cupin family protein